MFEYPTYSVVVFILWRNDMQIALGRVIGGGGVVALRRVINNSWLEFAASILLWISTIAGLVILYSKPSIIYE